MVNRTPAAALLFVLGIGLPPGAFAADDDVVVGILEHLSPAQKKPLDDAYGDVAQRSSESPSASKPDDGRPSRAISAISIS
jgi:hypothetical protein